MTPAVRPMEEHRPPWWPPACERCGGKGFVPTESESYTACRVCGATGNAMTHDAWTRLRLEGLR